MHHLSVLDDKGRVWVWGKGPVAGLKDYRSKVSDFILEWRKWILI